MEGKSTFLNGILEEEVYIEKPQGIFDVSEGNMVCKLHKELYGLKQSPSMWYERLHNYLVEIGFAKNY